MPGVGAQRGAVGRRRRARAAARLHDAVEHAAAIICGGRTWSLPKHVHDERTAAPARRRPSPRQRCPPAPRRASAAASRSAKIRGELTIAAAAGFASGTLMTSMRKSAEFGSCPASARRSRPARSATRMARSPRRRCRRSLGPSDPRPPCACASRGRSARCATNFGFAMSLMSKMRTPRMRSVLTVSGTPPAAAVEPPVVRLGRHEEQVLVDRHVVLRRRAVDTLP